MPKDKSPGLFHRLFSLLPLISLSLFFSCQNHAPLGTKDNPVKLYFTPSVDSATIASNSQVFLRFLEKETGLIFKTGIPTNYIAVVEAFGSKRADIGVMNSFGYLMAHDKYGASAKLRVLRYGHDYYQGQIIARADGDIKSIKDLDGKKMAFVDPSSTSGYMFPLKMMKDAGVTPGNMTFANKHDNVVIMLYQGQVQAGATYYSEPDEKGNIRDARARVKTQFPDVEEKIKIVAITDKIPNDPFVFRKDLPPEITSKFISAVKKFIGTGEGREIFKHIYSVEGIADTSDEDYNSLREMIKAMDLDTSKLVH